MSEKKRGNLKSKTAAVVAVRKNDAISLGKFILSSTGLEASGTPTEEDWQACGRALSQMEGSVHWWIGDWLRLHRGEWGQMYEEAEKITGFANQTLRNDKGVSDSFELSRRRDKLSHGHHETVKALEEDDQERWLDLAEKEGLSVARLRSEIRTEAKAKALEASSSSEDGHVVKGNALDFLPGLPDHEADLLLTDPPYMTDVPDIAAFAASWVPLAISKVKSSGRAYIFTGAYPQEIHAYLEALGHSDWLTLENLLVWTYRNTLGPAPADVYKLNWQACFYLKGPDAPPLNCPEMLEHFTVQDVPAPDGRFPDGRLHAWEKPEEIAERFIRHSTEAGAKVIDPFAGTGTFVATALRLGRKAIGCELSDEMLKICKKRGLKIHET